MDCLFCKIANGEIPSYKIYEDEFTLAFLDIAKDVVGHTVIIPKNHCDNIVYSDSKTLNHVFETVQLISKHYIENCGFEGVNIVSNCNECAGQTIKHFHVHIIPRKKSDGVKNWELGKQEMDLEEIKNKLTIK